MFNLNLRLKIKIDKGRYTYLVFKVLKVKNANNTIQNKIPFNGFFFIEISITNAILLKIHFFKCVGTRKDEYFQKPPYL